jgi:cytosine/adenosine deaminase-related metal-dependent hydrolase
MTTTLLSNIDYLYTFNDQDQSFRHVDVLIENGIISKIGKNIQTVKKDGSNDTKVIDATGLVLLPGFVNTHHHLYQTLFRGISEVQEKPLFPWLKGLYQFWQHMTPETVYYGAMVGFSELIRTGCTLTADHHYVFPSSQPTTLIDEQIRAAKDIGIRFHATRGSMSLGVNDGGLPPMSVVQKESAILEDSQRLIDSYHNSDSYAMTRIALAPCSPFSVTATLMKETSRLARQNKVMMHTHLAETIDEENFCLEKYKRRPFELMEDLEWVGDDVWYAHGIYLSHEEINRLGGSGIAHCPSSNMKLNSGICKTSELVKSGAKLSIAVDGSASNDGSNMWEEVRRAYLLNHLKYGVDGLDAYQILKVATRGGAEVLGRKDTGYIDIGMAADLNLFDLSGIEYAGCHDPLVSLVCLGNHSFPKMTLIQGKIIAIDGQIKTVSSLRINAEARKHASALIAHERNLKKK